MRIEISGGVDLLDALKKAAVQAADRDETVSFAFNGMDHEVMPGEDHESAKARAEKRVGHKLLTRDEAAERAKADLEQQRAESDAAIAQAGVLTEKEMREAKVPRLDTEEELLKYIHGLVDRPQDYGTCVYAMSMAATAAFNYAARKLGVTGFQASCADMDIIRRTRHLKHGYRLVDYNDVLYPQFWDEERRPMFQALIREPESRKRFALEAQKLIDESRSPAPAVLEHWKTLAAGAVDGLMT
jgi:hypothetical protein